MVCRWVGDTTSESMRHANALWDGRCVTWLSCGAQCVVVCGIRMWLRDGQRTYCGIRNLITSIVQGSSKWWPWRKWNNKRRFVCIYLYTVIPRLTKIIRSGITFVSRNVMLSGVSLLAVSNVNRPVGLVGLPYVMWSAHFFVTHIQTEKISSWNGPTVHVCCFI